MTHNLNLFEHCINNGYSVYPSILDYYYFQKVNNKNFINEVNKYKYVFIASDINIPISKCSAHQFMTSSETPDTFMWSDFDYSNYNPLQASEFTDVPTVGFVGRCPILNINGSKQLHIGFEPRYNSLKSLLDSKEICTDFHVRFEPDGDSAGFWNESLPCYKKHQPLFKTNMLANQYQVCARGNANWSLRFYETLAYGRIPIYIESCGKTLGNLGRERLNKDAVPFVYIQDMKNIEKDVLDFHNSISSIENVQKECREYYIEHYTFEKQIENFESAFSN